MTDDDEMPIASVYRGVGIHAGQPPKRVALVKREIDRVSKTEDLLRLSLIARDCAWSPESRIYAAARCLAGLRRAVERREPRPDIDQELMDAYACGLASRGWRNPFQYCSLLDADHERAAEREERLPNEATEKLVAEFSLERDD